MNAITPENEIPPAQRTAASGTLPTEQTNESTATSGPTSTFSSSCGGAPGPAGGGPRTTSGGGGGGPPVPARKSLLKNAIGSRATKPAIRKPATISFQSI